MSKEITCCEEFERMFNVRLAEKCCANCKHGEREYEGCATCKHPKRNDTEYWYKDEDTLPYAPYNVKQFNVCDLWEAKGKTK